MARRRFRRRRYRRRYAPPRIPWSMKTKLWDVRENIEASTDGTIIAPQTAKYFAIPMNHLVLWNPDPKPTATQYVHPTSMAGKLLPYKAETLIGTYNRFIIMGAKVRMKISVVANSPRPLRVWWTIAGTGGGSNAGTGFADTVNYLRTKTNVSFSSMQGMRHADVFNTQSGRNVFTMSRYVATRKMLHIRNPFDDEHLKMDYPTIDTTDPNHPIQTGTVPDSDHSYGLFVKLNNFSETDNIHFNVRVSITWYVRLFDRVRNLRDIVSFPGEFSPEDDPEPDEPTPPPEE